MLTENFNQVAKETAQELGYEVLPVAGGLYCWRITDEVTTYEGTKDFVTRWGSKAHREPIDAWVDAALDNKLTFIY